MTEDGRPDGGSPGLAPTPPGHPAPAVLLVVDGERFRVGRPVLNGPQHAYDYVWLTGPNPGYGFAISGPFELGEDDHRAQIAGFLADIDLETGFLRDE